MKEKIQVINTVITQLDALTVQGARNMTIVLNCIQQLAQLKENIAGGEGCVQNKAE